VRVEVIDDGLAERETDTARDRRPEQEPAQEGDAVLARALAPDDDERRGEHQRAGRGGDSVDEYMERRHRSHAVRMAGRDAARTAPGHLWATSPPMPRR
jgi:hypothetical protein